MIANLESRCKQLIIGLLCNMALANKSIDSTALRPDGARVLYAPVVQVNLRKYIKQLKSEQTWKSHNHNTITIYKSENTTIVLRGMHKGSELKEREVKGDITLQVLKGKINLTAGEQKFAVRKGNIMCIEHNVSHRFVAARESFFLLTIANRV